MAELDKKPGIYSRLKQWCDEDERYKPLLTSADFFRQYAENQLKTNSVSFGNFSLHDISHCEKILSAMEMVLGEDRVAMLGATDLWLLLLAAYMHDVGMCYTPDDIKKEWNTEKFFKFILKKSQTVDKYDEQELLYCLFDKTNHRLRPPEEIFNYYQQGKPESDRNISVFLDLCRYIRMLFSDYRRTKHSDLTADFIQTELKDPNRKNTSPFSVFGIQNRLWNVCGRVCESHGHDLSDIMKRLEWETDGFYDIAHPRFAALLLCLCDLLDADCDRFDLNMVRAFGGLSEDSLGHYEKHLHVSHLLITPETIELCYDLSDLFQRGGSSAKNLNLCLNVYNAADRWNDWIDNCLRFWNEKWYEIVPRGLPGKTPVFSKRDIIFSKNDRDESDRIMREYEIQYKQAFRLISEHIYGIRDVFIRELVQNAVDATKLRLYDDISEFLRLADRQDPDKETDTEPVWDTVSWLAATFAVLKERGDEYTVRTEYVFDENPNIMRMLISDNGIGMNDNSVERMQHIGELPKIDVTYHKSKMPGWLRPTGDFNIGMHSAFAVTDRMYVRSYHAKDGCFKNLTLHSREEGARIVNLPDTLCVQKRDKSGTDISADIYLTEQGLNRKGLFSREPTVEDDYVISKLNEATSRFLLDENVIPLSFRYFKKNPKFHPGGVTLNDRFQPSYDLLQSEKQYASVFEPFLADGPERKKEDTDHAYLSAWKKYLAALEAEKGIYILPVKEKDQQSYKKDVLLEARLSLGKVIYQQSNKKDQQSNKIDPPTMFNILYVDADRYNRISEKNLLLKIRFSYAAEQNAKIKNIIFKGARINPLGDSYDDSRRLALPYAADSDETKLHILSRSARESVSADRSHINSETVDSIQQELWKITDALVKYLAAPKENQSPYERLTPEECLCLLPYFYRSLWETEDRIDQAYLGGVIREVYEKAALCEKVPFNGIEALTDDLCHENPSLQTVHLDDLSVFDDPLSQFYPMKTPFGYSYHYYLGSDMNFIGSLPKTSYHTENGGRCYFFPSDIWEAVSAPLRISCMTAVNIRSEEMFYIRYTQDDSGYIYADAACRRVFFKNWLQWYRTGTEQSVYRDLYIPAFEEYKAIALRKEVLFLASEKWGLCDAFIRVPQHLFEEDKEKSGEAISEDEMTYLTGLAEKYSYDPLHFNAKEARTAYTKLFEEMKSVL